MELKGWKLNQYRFHGAYIQNGYIDELDSPKIEREYYRLKKIKMSR